MHITSNLRVLTPPLLPLGTANAGRNNLNWDRLAIEPNLINFMSSSALLPV